MKISFLIFPPKTRKSHFNEYGRFLHLDITNCKTTKVSAQWFPKHLCPDQKHLRKLLSSHGSTLLHRMKWDLPLACEIGSEKGLVQHMKVNHCCFSAKSRNCQDPQHLQRQVCDSCQMCATGRVT